MFGLSLLLPNRVVKPVFLPPGLGFVVAGPTPTSHATQR